MRPFDVMVMLSRGTGAPQVEGLKIESYSRKPSFTPMWNCMGLPALSIPIGYTNDGMPLSLQIVGKPFDEATVLRVGDAFQQLTDWHLRLAPLVMEAEPVFA